jgi:murein DD-endopeptidase MepM/ murein hydrolase activator NlpD
VLKNYLKQKQIKARRRLTKKVFLFIVGNIVTIIIAFFLFIIVSAVVGWFIVASEDTDHVVIGPGEGGIVVIHEGSPLLPPYTITEEYGYYTGVEASMGGHYGTDMSGGYGANVMSVLPGRVVYSVSGCTVGDTSCGGGYGNYVTIEHQLEDGSFLYTRYGHLDSVLTYNNAIVEKGRIIGLQGNTGISTGTHLHFEVRISDDFNHDNTRNPREYFKF